jgi:hypothetical protein
MGSRQTQHFYSAGFEYFGKDDPLAQKCAQRMLESLSSGKLVPPEVMSSRYTFYRIEEFLVSWLVWSPRKAELPPLPHEGPDFERYYPEAQLYARKKGKHYLLVNLLKGGIIKAFDGERLVLNDTGVHLRTEDGKIFSSQWIADSYKVEVSADHRKLTVEGDLQKIPTQLFQPLTMAGFKVFVSLMGNNRTMADAIKKQIRRALIVSAKKQPGYRFRREIEITDDAVIVRAELSVPPGSPIAKAGIGGEIHQRYVPQSRYFQSQELDIAPRMLTPHELTALRQGEPFRYEVVLPG